MHTPTDTAPARPGTTTSGLLVVPVLGDDADRVWLLPACRVVPGAPGATLVESAELPEALHAAARTEALRRGPGRHHLVFQVDAGAGDAGAGDAGAVDAGAADAGALVDDALVEVDGWALAEELLGIDLSPAGNPAAGSVPAPVLPTAEPPRPSGHAVSAWLSAPEASPEARVLHRRLPQGPGVRVVHAAEVGSVVGRADLLQVVAHGRDRTAALRRLQHALAHCTVVVEGAPTTRCALLAAVTDELDQRTDERGPDPLAVLIASVHASDTQRATQRAAFHSRAARGRPEPLDVSGVPTTLNYAGVDYVVAVHETSPHTYRIDTGDQVAELAVTRRTPYEWTVTCAGIAHEVVVNASDRGTLLEIDGLAHEVVLDDGLPVRAEWPALVVSVAVAAGQPVEPGDPLLVVEAMKMESTIRAPFAGVIVSVEVLPNEQVDSGIPLVRIRPPALSPLSGTEEPRSSTPLSFAGMALADVSGRPPCERVYDALSSYLLGYELDPASRRSLLAEQRALANRAGAADATLLASEDTFIDLFAELGLLWQTQREPAPIAGSATDSQLGAVTSAHEYLIGYLQWLDPDRIGMPELMRRRLARVLARYGVTDLRRNPELENAVVRLFSSQSRMTELSGVVTNLLERRLRYRDRILPLIDSSARARYDRLTAATQGQLETIADLSRDARFRFVDEPVIEAGRAAAQADMETHLDALAEDPNRPDRAERIAALVACPLPLRGTILRRRISTTDPDLQTALLEVRAGRWYRIRELRDRRVLRVAGVPLCVADYDYEGRSIHVVLAFAPLAGLAEVGRAVATHLAGVDPARSPIVDVMSWRPDAAPNGDELAAAVHDQLAQWDLGRPAWRIDITVSSLAADADPETRTQYLTFRADPAGGLSEDAFYRNLHPMLAKRLELWRLGNFTLTRLPSPEDVYLFHGVAKGSAKDHRLFALAEVRDMTSVPRGRGAATTYPMLERMGLQAIIAMRRARAGFPERDKPQANRITLFVRPPWDVPRENWSDLAELLVPLAGGAGLEMVVLRTVMREPDGSLRPTVLNVDGIIQRSITVTEEPSRDDIVRPLTRYRQKVLTAQRFGVPYPFEILRMFAPPPGTVSKFKPAHFEELDLDESGERLVPVIREPGLNTANLVVGLLTNYSSAYPDGMTRVAMLSDPTRGLGNLAEPECRLVNAALALAAERAIPVEWFAVSSGALISMESGTENMDWIALTLRRIIEFTQAGGEINVIVTGINVGGQPYWNAEATMLMHTRGILVMTPTSAMVLTGKQALDFSGGVSADDNFGIGGFDRVMGPNGQAQYWAASLSDACELLLHHYEYTYVAPGERFPRRLETRDEFDRDVRTFPHAPIPDSDFTTVGDIFSAEKNPERKKPFDVRSVMRAVSDQDSVPLERWERWRGGENSVVWDARIGGISVCLLGLESHPVPRRGFVPADGPPKWTSGTLFPQASRKTARAVTAASGNRPLVVLANLSGFDGSPESMRHWQLEYGAEIGRAVTNFDGPIVFVVISRYHGGAFVVFSKALNESMQVAAVEGSYASVIGGAPAAATVFAREVRSRVQADARVVAAKKLLAGATGPQAAERAARLAEITEQVRSEKLGEAAAEFDAVHTIERALRTGSVDEIIPGKDLRPWIINALEAGMARTLGEA